MTIYDWSELRRLQALRAGEASGFRAGAVGRAQENYFQDPSSLNCAIDCLGISIASLHSVQTLTRTFGKVTRERLSWMERFSKRVVTGFRQA
jgi:hypothetical protein